MGILWNLLQQSQISTQSDLTTSLEQRVQHLEAEVQVNRELLHRLLVHLEQRLGEDIDGDQRIG